MQRLLLIEVAVCAALIMVAVLIMVRRWRRRRRKRSVPSRERRTVAVGLAGAGEARHPAAVVPGFSDDAITSGSATPSGPGAYGPARPEPAAERRVGDVAGPEPEQAAGLHVNDMASPRPRLNGPARKPDAQQAADAAGSDRIYSYYEEADRQMSDYLAALGWDQDPGTRDPETHDPGVSAE